MKSHYNSDSGEEVSGELLREREIELKIDIRSASILVIPKPDEVQDKNMPKNLHNAAELFLRVGMWSTSTLQRL